MTSALYSFYKSAFFSITRGNHKGVVINAKPIYYLTLIDFIDKGLIQNNRIYFTAELQKDYIRISKIYQPNITPTPFFKPFFYSKSEHFYHLQTKTPLKEKGLSSLYIRDNVDYAYLDNALWDLLQNPKYRIRLRSAIVKHFFGDEFEKESVGYMAAEPEQNYGNMEGEATPRQLWALKLATGVDYRGQGLTKAEASEMIAKAKQEAEEKGEKTFSNEATTRQLNYLKRTTGIDYSDKGLTKAEATKMIRELKEAEEDASIAPREEEAATTRQLNYLKRATGVDYTEQGLTKREASKMISEIIDNGEGEAGVQSAKKKTGNPDTYIKPGSLEDILSKCKTREEQLEAARRFFGEDK